MSAELKRAFVERLWALACLERLDPASVAAAARVTWEVDEEAPPPSRRHAWQRFAYSGLVREPFAAVVLAWQPERGSGRLEVTPSRIVTFARAELDAALRAAGAPEGAVGIAPAIGGSDAPFAGARSTQVVYVVPAGRLRLAFDASSLRTAEIAPP